VITMLNFRYLLIFTVFLLSGCASTGLKETLLENSSNRSPASQTQLSYSAGQLYAAIEAVEAETGLWFSKISAIRIFEPSIVEVDVVDEDGQLSILKFQINESHCGLSDCPLKAERVN